MTDERASAGVVRLLGRASLPRSFYWTLAGIAICVAVVRTIRTGTVFWGGVHCRGDDRLVGEVAQRAAAKYKAIDYLPDATRRDRADAFQLDDGIPVHWSLRTRASAYRGLISSGTPRTDNELLGAMPEHLEPGRRPILVGATVRSLPSWRSA